MDSKSFIGRESELDAMREALQPDDQSPEHRLLVLGGTGGIGKTQLAIAYAARHRNDYESIFWLNATSEATLQDSLRSMAEVIFDVQEPGVLEGEQILIQVRRWLSNTKNTRWLLIYDNYDEPEQFDINKCYPPASHGTIIVTTRRPDRVMGKRVRVQPLQNIEESLEILKVRSLRAGVESDPHAKRLAERLGGLPLALATAGAYLSQSTFTFARYLQEYERRWNIDPRRPLQLQEYRNRTLYTTWDLSYTRLESDNLTAARLLRLLAYFDNQSFWYELFRGGLTDDTPAWLHAVIAHDVEFESVMRTLMDYCVVEVRTTLHSWSMHTSVHDWTFAALNKTIDAQHYWYAFDCVAASIDEDEWDSLAHLKYARLTVHATWLAQERFHRNELMDNILSHRLDKAFNISELLTMQVQFGVAEQMYLLTLAGREKALGPDHTLTLSTVNSLGRPYRHQGKLGEAEQMYQRALVGYKKALASDHTSTLKTVNDLGVLYRDQGKLVEAEHMYQRALAGYENTLGLDHKSTHDTVYGFSTILLACAWKAKFLSTEIHYSLPQKVNQLLQLTYTWQSKVLNVYGALGRALLWNSDEINAQIAFQQQIKLHDRVFVYASIQCDGCHLPISCAKERDVCKHCLDIDLCGHCFRMHETGDKAVPSCINHRFLEVAADKLSGSSEIVGFDDARRASWLRNLLTGY